MYYDLYRYAFAFLAGCANVTTFVKNAVRDIFFVDFLHSLIVYTCLKICFCVIF